MLKGASTDPDILALLSSHPKFGEVAYEGTTGLTFSDGVTERYVRVDDQDEPLYGLVELMDNNPLVCADSISVPSAAGTLALIALGPLASAGLILERPSLVLNVPADLESVDWALSSERWTHGANIHVEPQDLKGIAVASGIAVIPSPAYEEEITELFEERFGRSFYVRRWNRAEWSPELVRDEPFALYQLSINFDSPTSLVTVRVLADLKGKCGAAQVVHAMNVMCGFEESLGIG